MKNIVCLIGWCFLLGACSSSKFDYQTAYKFSHHRYVTKQAPSSMEPVASIKPEFFSNRSPKALQSLPSDKALKDLAGASAEAKAAAFVKHYKQASKEEKKEIRKQVKEQYKTLKQQVKKAKKEAAANEIYFNKKMYIGLVLFAAGILIAILASGALGAVIIIVGIGLIAWGFIEQA